jgi:hypothetical protein
VSSTVAAKTPGMPDCSVLLVTPLMRDSVTPQPPPRNGWNLLFPIGKSY